MRGRGLAAVLVLAALPAAAPAAEVALDWSVADRLRGPASIKEDAPARPIALRVELEGTCPREPRWTLDGQVVRALEREGCTFDLPLGAAGSHELELDVGSGDPLHEQLDVRDLLVVSLGDSVASGEGNPDGPGPRWLERRCHRSLRSGAAQAALAAERGDRRSVVSFVPLGCSGATIQEGLLGSYQGIQPDARKGELPPQVDILRTLDARRPVDAVLVSVGANDAFFGPLLSFCRVVDPCDERRFEPADPSEEAADPNAPTAAVAVREALAGLSRGYDELAVRLRPVLDADHVVIVEYFNPLRDEDGELCRAALPGVSRQEAAWAERAVLRPLNEQVRAAAVRHGWRLVGGVADAFRTHGTCAGGDARWIRRWDESLLRQLGIHGTMHPNERGHLATAALIAPVLATTLGLDAGATGSQVVDGQDESDGIAWWLLPVAALVGAATGAGIAVAVLRHRRRRRT
jgi:lysophospholipase L1-like esterase